ncbi:MAG: Fis family transcriptional regulator [Bacteroidetes bacterium]|jgi:sigma-E factor negative regulatory protein RseC|nr:Fis family transcriptional regulator [Bacteroidota bacterium]MBT3749577.1 Fis family transcriptional regulator [Bacteroidota bacterium]MBT4398045.1 Fis family transcriptional regulator [Bacteroidota bacterium]MBT4408664.1 Fis family transcriptional regulator [Bacteroidota bacterium]MBT5427099.1 Fis family transcriptional regulator [Bacteroidota bacterium]
MRARASIEHLGRVESICDNLIRVGFVSHSSCSSCHAKGVCAVSDVDSKYIEVEDIGRRWDLGETVKIVFAQKEGFKALWYGYVLPLLVLLAAMIITFALTGKDGLSGLVAIGILIPYYLCLYFFRDKLKNKFTFIIKKID